MDHVHDGPIEPDAILELTDHGREQLAKLFSHARQFDEIGEDRWHRLPLSE
jgi:hypothetical protein